MHLALEDVCHFISHHCFLRTGWPKNIKLNLFLIENMVIMMKNFRSGQKLNDYFSACVFPL